MGSTAVELAGNTSAKISRLRQEKATQDLNKVLMPVAREGGSFKDAPPSLFGAEFAKKAKEHIDQVKAMRAVPPCHERGMTVFSRAPPTGGGGNMERGINWQRPEQPIPKRGIPEQNLSEERTPKNRADQELTLSPSHISLSHKNKNKIVKNTLNPTIADMGVVPVVALQAVAGRLKYRHANWQIITKDRWVLDTVQGYCIELNSQIRPLPSGQASTPSPTVWGGANSAIEGGARRTPSERSDGRDKGPSGPEEGRKQRPVINFVRPHHFKMEGLHTLKDLLRPRDWFAKVYLKDAYFTIPIHGMHREYLRFVLENKTCQFNCLPFGLTSAPWVFIKTLKPIAALLSRWGVRLICYIDDILILAESMGLAEEQVKGLHCLLGCFGFIIHLDKSVLTRAQTMEFLGISTHGAEVTSRKIRAEARKMSQQPKVSARMLSRLLGK